METQQKTVHFENSETSTQNCGKRMNASPNKKANAKRKRNDTSTAAVVSNCDVKLKSRKKNKVAKMRFIVDDLPAEV